MSSNLSKKLIIVLGEYGAGKTTFAKWYAKNNKGMFLDFELLYFEKTENETNQFDIFVNRLASTIQKSSNHLFVMDGYQAVTDGYEKFADPPFAYLQNKINCDIQLCLCFAAPHVIRKRQIAKVNKGNTAIPHHDESEIKKITYSLFGLVVTTNSEPLFVDTTDGFHFISKQDWLQRWRELTFFSDLDKMPHDKYYQDIELPSGLQIPGYSESHKTWERLHCLIDFRDKDVLDLGCFHGFFSFKAEEAGARSIAGIEINENAIEVARRIAWLKNSKALFCQGDLANFKTNQVYGIVLVLNILHHVRDIHGALQNIFRAGKLIVFEIPVTQEDIITQYANQFGFKPTGKMNSHREEREIIIFTSPQVNVVLSQEIPDAYQYSYNKEYAIRFLKRLSGFKILYPLRWLVRQYRSFRKPSSSLP